MSTNRTAVQKRNTVAEIVRISPILLDRSFSKKEFQEISGNYPELQMERETDGKIRIMSPVKAGSGSRESKVILFLGIWWFQTRKAKTFYPAWNCRWMN